MQYRRPRQSGHFIRFIKLLSSVLLFCALFGEQILKDAFPLLSFYDCKTQKSEELFLLYGYRAQNRETVLETEEYDTENTDEIKEIVKEVYSGEIFTEESVPEREEKTFLPHEKQTELDYTALLSYENLLKNFYVIDSGALAGTDLLNINDLKDTDVSLPQENKNPVILIYHTHSKEMYKDEDGESGGVLEAGDLLAKILREDYGYEVIQCREEFDTVRDEAYGKSLPYLEALLDENPDIAVIIDLHRDSGNINREMTVEEDGVTYAKFMFFNGISRSKNTGEIAYLHNENLKENLAFSFQMQAKANEYYPGITRKIYIKQYRYNLHLRPRSLLIELGDENNTLKEAQNSCYPLAHILDMVLSGTG